MNKLELEGMIELSRLGFSVIANQRLRLKVSILISTFKKKKSLLTMNFLPFFFSIFFLTSLTHN